MTKSKKKILSLLLALGLFFVTVANAIPVDATTFKARTTAPEYSNKYYNSNLNIFYAAGYGMPNCTAYAYGRTYELTGKVPKLCTSNAKYWWDYNKTKGYYKYGQEPKLGAIAVWGGISSFPAGHVAVVEKITNTTVTVSESRYTSKVYFTTTEFKKGNMNYSWNNNFLGYIYPYESTTSSNTSSSNTASSTNPLSYTVPTRSIYYTSSVMTGNDVKFVESALKKLGYSINIDGSFSSSDAQVVKQFQSNYNLSADGSCGPATLKKLRQVINDPYLYTVPTRTIYYSSSNVMTGNDVKFVQTALKYLGYSITVDGSFGPSAQKVLKQFQSDNNLSVDGSCGPATLAKLQTCLKK